MQYSICNIQYSIFNKKGASLMMNYQYAIRYTLHASRSARTIAQKNLFMQNKPNLLNAQMLVNCVLTMDYVNIRLRRRWQNKAKQTQFKPNSNPIKPNFLHFFSYPFYLFTPIKPASQSNFNQ